MRALAAVVVVVSLVAACGEDPCKGITGQCTAVHAGATAQDAQAALLAVAPGGTVAFAAGTFDFRVDLSLDVSNVTIVGAGDDKTILSFAKQTEGAQGLLVTATNDFAIRDLAIEDTPGDALKILGTTGVTIQHTRVEWTAGPNTTNGAYGLYPVQCTNVLIDGNTVKGASDSGVYVGQSDTIIVSNNDVENNVAGIEIENSSHAEVFGNTATNNTGGILVFNLPGLQVETAAATSVHDNMIFSNNTPNFAPNGNIVGLVPTGTGFAILAAHQVEFFANTVRDHATVNVGAISWVPLMKDAMDPTYDQYPTALYIHDNDLSGTSDMPTGELGALLIGAIGEIAPNGPFVVADLVWDGVMDPKRVQSSTGDYADADKICIQRNGSATFMNIEYPLGDATKPSTDLSPHDCSHPSLPPVTIP